MIKCTCTILLKREISFEFFVFRVSRLLKNGGSVFQKGTLETPNAVVLLFDDDINKVRQAKQTKIYSSKAVTIFSDETLLSVV